MLGIMPAFVMDVLLKIIIVTQLIEFSYARSADLNPEVNHYRALPPSTAADARRKPKSDSPLIKYQAQEDTGYYKFGYAVADGQYRVEEGSPQDGVLGSYGYIRTDGKEVKVFYLADSQGFQILTAEEYRILSEAKKRKQFHPESDQPGSVQPAQENGFYPSPQGPANGPEESEVDVFTGNKHEFYPAPEDDSETKPVTDTPGIDVNGQLPNEPADVQPQQPPFIFNQNMFPNRFPTSFPIFVPPSTNTGFVNQIPTFYYPNIRYENPFIKIRNRFAAPHVQHFSPLIIRI